MRSVNFDTSTIEITSTADDGRGIALLENGKRIFVEDALQGELVSLRRINKRRGNFTASVNEVIKPSPHRVRPECAHFGVCGGCRLQHMSHREQISIKSASLIEHLQRIGNLESVKLETPILANSPWHYRRKARLGVRLVPKKGGILVGFRERAKSYITPLEFCHVLTRPFADCMPSLAKLIERLSIRDRVPQVELAAGDNKAALVFRHLAGFNEQDLHLLRKFAKHRDFQLYLQPGGIESAHCIHPPNPESLMYQIDGSNIQIEFHPLDFVQVNAEINKLLVDCAVEWLNLRPSDRVLDLFCGVGNFTLPIARRVKHAFGLEFSEKLVKQASSNAKLNKINNAMFVDRNLDEGDINEFVRDNGINVLVIDPPRTGALNVIKTFDPTLKVDRIIYVSCNSTTLARDAGILVHQHGFAVESARVVDMFPQTAHSEVVILFAR